MKRPRGRGTLLILTLFLGASGALRLGSGIGTAMANSAVEGAPSVDPAVCPAPPLALAEALMARETEVAARESALADRMAALALAEEAIKMRTDEMVTAETELKKTLQIADGASEADLTRLTAVYEAMKPADASKLFTEMAPEFAAGFLGRMTPATAAAVIAGMDPGKAYSISVLIAGRNALAPKN
jgi:flagellar motility protein MotE (MotC chaperone)